MENKKIRRLRHTFGELTPRDIELYTRLGYSGEIDFDKQEIRLEKEVTTFPQINIIA